MTSNIQMTTDLTKLVLLPRRIFQLGCIQKTICILIRLFLPKKAESADTAKRYGFRTVCGDTWTRNDPAGCDNGYENRELLFDENLTITPPPSFPTTGSFTILTWKEKD